jgi:hypothetical protein
MALAMPACAPHRVRFGLREVDALSLRSLTTFPRFVHPANAATEGMNFQIETVWEAACGFGKKKRFRTIILFHLGGLDLYPATH